MIIFYSEAIHKKAIFAQKRQLEKNARVGNSLIYLSRYLNNRSTVRLSGISNFVIEGFDLSISHLD